MIQNQPLAAVFFILAVFNYFFLRLALRTPSLPSPSSNVSDQKLACNLFTHLTARFTILGWWKNPWHWAQQIYQLLLISIMIALGLTEQKVSPWGSLTGLGLMVVAFVGFKVQSLGYTRIRLSCAVLSVALLSIAAIYILTIKTDVQTVLVLNTVLNSLIDQLLLRPLAISLLSAALFLLNTITPVSFNYLSEMQLFRVQLMARTQKVDSQNSQELRVARVQPQLSQELVYNQFEAKELGFDPNDKQVVFNLELGQKVHDQEVIRLSPSRVSRSSTIKCSGNKQNQGSKKKKSHTKSRRRQPLFQDVTQREMKEEMEENEVNHFSVEDEQSKALQQQLKIQIGKEDLQQQSQPQEVNYPSSMNRTVKIQGLYLAHNNLKSDTEDEELSRFQFNNHSKSKKSQNSDRVTQGLRPFTLQLRQLQPKSQIEQVNIDQFLNVKKRKKRGASKKTQRVRVLKQGKGGPYLVNQVEQLQDQQPQRKRRKRPVRQGNENESVMQVRVNLDQDEKCLQILDF